MPHRINFVSHIAPRRRFHPGFFLAGIALCCVVILVMSYQAMVQQSELREALAKEQAAIHALRETLKPQLENEHGSHVAAILANKRPFNSRAFYPLMTELSHLTVPGLWLTSIHTSMRNGFLRLKGQTYSTANLDTLFEKIKQQRYLGLLVYKGVEVSPGELPELPFGVESTVVVPTFYQFTIQTDALDKQQAIKKEMML